MKTKILILVCVILFACSSKKVAEPIRTVNEHFYISSIFYENDTCSKYFISSFYQSNFHKLLYKYIPDSTNGKRINENVFFFYEKPGKFETGQIIEFNIIKQVKLNIDTVLKKKEYVKPIKVIHEIKKDSLN